MKYVGLVAFLLGISLMVLSSKSPICGAIGGAIVWVFVSFFRWNFDLTGIMEYISIGVIVIFILGFMFFPYYTFIYSPNDRLTGKTGTSEREKQDEL